MNRISLDCLTILGAFLTAASACILLTLESELTVHFALFLQASTGGASAATEGATQAADTGGSDGSLSHGNLQFNFYSEF